MAASQDPDSALALLRARTKRPLLVAIDGYSAAGKSTLADRIASALPDVTVVPTDDFYRVMDEQERFALSPSVAYERDYDWERLRREVFEPLRKGVPATYRCFDWNSGVLGDVVHIEPGGIVVVEGVYSLRPALRGHYDVAIFVAAPSSVREARQALRPESDAWKLRWDAAERFYVNTYRPDLAADLVVSGAGTDGRSG